MKKIYALYAAAFALFLAGAVVLLSPPRTVYACGGYAMCQYGAAIHIPPGATSCSCTDNVGCTWTKDGKTIVKNVRPKAATSSRLSSDGKIGLDVDGGWFSTVYDLCWTHSRGERKNDG